ncbi:MAG: hypothetical protein RI564_08125 [Gracilimonas sp.]|jgi:hypothetical protein|nr:hypothetical protein [Gracilimonas sp.]
MKRFKNLFPSILVIAAVMLLSACVKTVNHSETTHVRDLVQSDVFTILPDNEADVEVHYNTDEIKGEYLELASVTVSVKESGTKPDKSAMIEKLKQEADMLGANAILVLETVNNKDGIQSKTQIRGMAIFKLDEIPQEMNEPIAALPS